MRPVLWAILAIAIVASAAPCLAISRYVDDNRFHRRSALSGYAGGGYPVGEFESSRVGDGNHEQTPIDWEAYEELNWGADIEHYFARKTSVGLTIGNVTYQDKSDPLLETHVSNFGGFLRYVLAPGGHLHPFLRFGVGGERVQFQDPVARYRSNTAWSIQAGGGLMLTMFKHLLFTGQAVYNHGFTENTYIPEADAVVGFDTKFWSVQAGVGILFP
jgi:hypothetical protein